MKFFELAVGDKFTFNGIIHEKVKEERVSCCKVGRNAVIYGNDSSKVVIKPLEDVEKFPVEPPATGHIAPAKAE
jgi:hypothetical protein